MESMGRQTKTPEARVTLVYSEDGDWIAFYINGELRRQDDSIQEDDVVALLEGHHVVSYIVLHRHLAPGGRFPKLLADLPPSPEELLGGTPCG